MTLAPWIVDRLIDDGTITANRVTRTPRSTRCPWCHAPVLAAIDDLAFETFCHPTPTTPAGELTALLAGRRTYTVVAGQLVHRSAHRIAWKSADEEPAYPSHECGSDIAFPMNAIHRERQKAARPKDDDPIPF